MRKNLPVTGHNIELSSSTNILSTTTPDSHITYVNPDFLKISGFAEEELIGQLRKHSEHSQAKRVFFSIRRVAEALRQQKRKDGKRNPPKGPEKRNFREQEISHMIHSHSEYGDPLQCRRSHKASPPFFKKSILSCYCHTPRPACQYTKIVVK